MANNSSEERLFLHELWLLSPEWQHRPSRSAAERELLEARLSCSRLARRLLARAVSWVLKMAPQTAPQVAQPQQWSVSLSPSGSCLAILQHAHVIFRFGADGFAEDHCRWEVPVDTPSAHLSAWPPSSTLFAFGYRCQRGDAAGRQPTANSAAPSSSASTTLTPRPRLPHPF